MKKGSAAVCWTLVLLAALFLEDSDGKGGRGGARGGARGAARSTARRSKFPSRYGSSGGALRVAAAAAGGAAVGAAAALAADRMRSANAGFPGNEDALPGNGTGEGSYNYRAWTSGAHRWHLAYLPACLLCTGSFFTL